MLNKTIKLKEMITTSINPKANANIFVKVLPFLFSAFLLIQLYLMFS